MISAESIDCHGNNAWQNLANEKFSPENGENRKAILTSFGTMTLSVSDIFCNFAVAMYYLFPRDNTIFFAPRVPAPRRVFEEIRANPPRSAFTLAMRPTDPRP